MDAYFNEVLHDLKPDHLYTVATAHWLADSPRYSSTLNFCWDRRRLRPFVHLPWIKSSPLYGCNAKFYIFMDLLLYAYYEIRPLLHEILDVLEYVGNSKQMAKCKSILYEKIALTKPPH